MAWFENNNNSEPIKEKIELTEEQKTIEIQKKRISTLKDEIMFNDISHANEQLNSKYTLELSHDSENDKYYIISWDESLRIPLSQNEIRWNLKIIVNMLNAEWHAFTWENSLTLRWYRHNRYIYQNDWMMTSSDDTELYSLEHYYKEDKNIKRSLNNEAEDLFRFVMSLKWIPEEDWDYDGVCGTGERCEIWLPNTWEYWEKIQPELIRETELYQDGKKID